MTHKLWIAPVPFLAMFIAISALAQAHSKVNCKGEFDYSKTQIHITGNYLKTVSADVALTPQTAPVDKWTVAILSQQRSLCESYKASTEQQFPTPMYLDQMNQLRAWELDFMRISAATQQVQDTQVAAAKATKGGTTEHVHAKQQALAAQIKAFLNSPPQVKPPATAAAPPQSYPDEPL